MIDCPSLVYGLPRPNGGHLVQAFDIWRALVPCLLLGIMLLLAANQSAAQSKKSDVSKANDGVITNWGKPKNYSIGKVNGYWVWHEDGVWCLRTTGGGKGAHQFVGQVEIAGGSFVKLMGLKGETGGKLVDRYIYNGDRSAIRFDFKTDEGVDGFNFIASPTATALKFTLAVDGNAAPNIIRVGRDGDHPNAAIFSAPAHPSNSAPTGKAKGKKK